MNFKKIVSAVSALAISVSAFVGLATTASAADTVATLVHTSSWSCGATYKDASGWTITLDAEKEHYNNEGSGTNQGYAFAEFTFDIPTGETISSAKLIWSNTGSQKTSRNNTIYYLNPGQTLNYSATTSNRYNGVKTKVESFSSNTAVTNRETDVTAAIVELVKANQSYVVFQWTANPQGIDLCGKTSENPPSLVITSSSETYDVSFLDLPDGATVTVNGVDATNGISLAPGEYTYIAKATGYETTSNTFTVVDNNLNVNVSMTALENVSSVRVDYKYDGQVIASEMGSIDGLYAGETAEIPFRAYILVDGKLYKTTPNSENPNYGQATTLTKETVVEKSVTPVDVEGTVALFADLDNTTAQNAGIRASYMSAYDNTAYTSSEIEPGVYTFILRLQNKSRGSSIVCGETKIYDAGKSAVNTWSNVEVPDVEITESAAVSIAAGENRTRDDYDIIIAVKTADLTKPSVSAVAGNQAKDGVNYMTWDATISNLGENVLDEYGFAFINTATLDTSNAVVWSKSTTLTENVFGAAIAQDPEAKSSTIYALPYIIYNNRANGVLGEAKKSDFK